MQGRGRQGSPWLPALHSHETGTPQYVYQTLCGEVRPPVFTDMVLKWEIRVPPPVFPTACCSCVPVQTQTHNSRRERRGRGREVEPMESTAVDNRHQQRRTLTLLNPVAIEWDLTIIVLPVSTSHTCYTHTHTRYMTTTGVKDDLLSPTACICGGLCVSL